MTKYQILKVLLQTSPAQHLETISFVVCQQTSYTFHTFPSQLQIFLCTPVRQVFFMSGKASHHFFLLRPHEPLTRPQFLATNHKLTVHFLGNESNYLVSHKGTGVSFIPGLGLYHDASVVLPKHLWMIQWEGK